MMITAMTTRITVKINTIEVAMLVIPVVATFMVGRSMVNGDEPVNAFCTSISKPCRSAPGFTLNMPTDILLMSSVFFQISSNMS